VKNSASHVMAVVLALWVATPALADVDLDANQRRNLGITTQRAEVVEAGRSWSASAQVLDTAPLIALLGDLHAAGLAAAASRGELDRTQRLYRDETNIAFKAVEAARAQAALDAGHVAAAKAQLRAGWGTALASLAADARARLLDDLSNSRIALVRAELLQQAGSDARFTSVELQTLDGVRHWQAQSLGTLPQTDVASIAGALLLRVATSLPQGLALIGTLHEPTAAIRGLGIPSAAIVRWHGSQWIYEETKRNHFVRHEVTPTPWTPGHVLLQSFTASRDIVTVGARALLAVEENAVAEE
jgi:hypothetical protein